MTALMLQATADGLIQAADLLKQGELVAFPTETVYGLGGLASSDTAIAKIYSAKNRPNFNPLIAHVHSLDEAKKLALFSSTALELAEHFWPGPLTMILPRTTTCPASLLASAGLDTIAIRIPAHPVARQLLEIVGEAVCAPSANLSGQVSPTTPIHVAQGLSNRIAAIVASGKCDIGVESTIIDLTADKPTILRFGGVTPDDLDLLLGPNHYQTIKHAVNDQTPSAPGQLTSHYAPSIPVKLNQLSAPENEVLLGFGPVLKSAQTSGFMNLSEKGDLNEAAANLFSMLRELDQPQYSAISVMPIPEVGIGLAINDRLKRAAAPK